jgi:hypothetical protein
MNRGSSTPRSVIVQLNDFACLLGKYLCRNSQVTDASMIPVISRYFSSETLND